MKTTGIPIVLLVFLCGCASNTVVGTTWSGVDSDQQMLFKFYRNGKAVFNVVDFATYTGTYAITTNQTNTIIDVSLPDPDSGAPTIIHGVFISNTEIEFSRAGYVPIVVTKQAKNREDERITRVEQAGPGYPPQGVGSPDP